MPAKTPINTSANFVCACARPTNASIGWTSMTPTRGFDRGDGGSDRGRERRRIAARAHHPSIRRAESDISLRQEYRLAPVARERGVTLVLDDADDLETLGLWRPDSQEHRPTERRLRRKELRRQHPIDDDLVHLGAVVGLGKRAALDRSRAHHVEVPGLDEVHCGLAELRRIDERLLGPVTREALARVEWQRVGCRHAGDAGQRLEPSRASPARTPDAPDRRESADSERGM